jgi:peptidoglycan pentaglycine glycine transferase (the first glycine)
MPILSEREWDAFLEDHPDAHILQTSAWGRLKSQFGWSVQFIRVQSTGAMVLFRKLPLGFSVGYIPKGPLGSHTKDFWPELDVLCRKQRTILLKVEPDLWETDKSSLEDTFCGFIAGAATVQPRRTILLSLEGNEELWLSRMKQKTRYNIRLSEKKGIRVEPSDNLDIFAELMRNTGERDGFGVHTPAYYHLAYRLFHSSGKCELLIAYHETKPLAGLMLFMHNRRAWYLYGGSNEKERNRMPAYLLQWEAMRVAARRGCMEYDLWGIPDEDHETLENQFEARSTGLWGVYRFKRGFGGEIKRSVGAFERVYMPAAYHLSRILLRKKED